jgi:hypothetical protein
MKLDQVGIVLPGGLDCPLPKMVRVEQRFRRERIDDIEATVRQQLASKLDGRSLSGKSIAITAGSRGIARIREILAAIVAQMKAWGARPFIVPAMASHGGATVEGQLRILETYGITEAAIGAPIKASMETIVAAKLKDGAELHFDRHASQADGIVVCGRVKPHTDFRGEYESGLYKMLAIGLGKHAGATALHKHGFSEFPRLIPEAGRALLKAMPVIVGVAIVENAYHEVMTIEAVRPSDFDAREKALLAAAKKSIARLLMPEIDLLVVDEIGKDISGSGMDPNVTGRGTENFMKSLDGGVPKIKRVLVRGVTEVSGGNATGIGFADMTTLRCVDRIDLGYTYTNTITSIELAGSKLPMVCNSDREAIVVGLRTCQGVNPQDARVVWIKNTNELTHIRVSESVIEDLAACPDVHVRGPAEPFRFCSDDYLVSGA